jgi:hypothetical protein
MRELHWQVLSRGAVLMLLMIGRDGALLSQDKATTQGSAAEMIPHLSDQDNDANPARAAIDAKARQQRYAEQQKQWIADAAKLATLANELKSTLDKAGSNTVSAGAVQKAADIEKLAKHLKDQMRNP